MQNSLIRAREASFQGLPFSEIVFGRYANSRRGIQTQSESSIQESKVIEKAVGCSSEAEIEVAVPDSQTDAKNAVKYSAISNLKVSSRHDLALIFTCKVCETRSLKTCCRESYDKGVVVVRCSGCNNLHLIADRLGWFGEPGSIEDLLAARGEGVKKGAVDSLNLTLEDLAGKKL
uniref:DNL-type domain-containing protein n=2 Tax=Opuntia streptacantha TaxID=393608 RepID=A0A7C9DU81_OPUST